MEITSGAVDSRVDERWAPVCEVIARLLSPHAEVVLHDPRSDRIVGIWNPVSGRQVGDPSLLAELDGLRAVDRDTYGPYLKSLPDGRRISSVSAVIRDMSGRAERVLCVNVDRTAFEDAARLLNAFATPIEPRPRVLFERDWTETVNDVIGAHVRERGAATDRLTRADRLQLLGSLDSAGIFSRRGSVPVVARALRVSRSMTYQLLAEARKERAEDADSS